MNEETNSMATKTTSKVRIPKQRLSDRRAKDPSAGKTKTVWETIDELIARTPEEEWAKLPKDGAKNIDHYLYGSPKLES